MKLLFSLEDQVHTFRAKESLEPSDLNILKDSLFLFFKSSPSFTILDLSGAEIRVPDEALNRALLELRTFALSKNLNLTIATSAVEALEAKQKVLEAALLKQVEILQAKLELREKLRKDAEKLLEENKQLKETVSQELDKMKALEAPAPILSPIMEKLWSQK